MNWMIHQSVSWCLGAHLLTSTVPYHETITRISCAYHVNPVLVAAIIHRESDFDPRKMRSEDRIGDVSRGLMQVTLRTAQWMGFQGKPEALFTPWINIRYGVRFLAYLLKKYPNVSDALAAYNDGRPHIRNGRYVSSRGSLCVDHYVKAVLAHSRTLLQASTAEQFRRMARFSEGDGLPSPGRSSLHMADLGLPNAGLFNRMEMGF